VHDPVVIQDPLHLLQVAFLESPFQIGVPYADSSKPGLRDSLDAILEVKRAVLLVCMRKSLACDCLVRSQQFSISSHGLAKSHSYSHCRRVFRQRRLDRLDDLVFIGQNETLKRLAERHRRIFRGHQPNRGLQKREGMLRNFAGNNDSR